MPNFIELTPEDAREFILKKKSGAIRVAGLVDLRGAKVKQINAQLACHDLDATGSQLVTLPHGVQVASRLTLDDCNQLESLPVGLECGSLSLRNCSYLAALPEKLSTWFLDLTNCQRFSQWPTKATIHRGSLVLRNCIEVQSLPSWLKLLAQLDVSGCVQLNDLPEGLKVSSWVDVGGANIKGLPKSLEGVSLRWRTVRIDERIAFHPETLTAKEILTQDNAELRRVMIERMGYLRFAEDAEAEILDEAEDAGGETQLLRIPLGDDEPLVGLSCSCPSTGRRYLLRVPPTVMSCHEAAAWMAGYDDPKKYKPIIET